MKQVIDTEVCVIGGGPSGSTIACKLAQFGHVACLIEKSAFPRRRLGESLPPSILPVLDGLGLRQLIESAGFLRPGSTIVRWASAGDVRKPYSLARGFHVDRGRFDALLLEGARSCGVQVLQPACAIHPQRHPQHGWLVRVRTNATVKTVRARIVVDATGRRGLRPHMRRRISTPTLALYGYWHRVPLDGIEARVEAAPDAWYWGAPLPDGSFNAMVFLDTQKCAGARTVGLVRLYREHLARSGLLRLCLRGCLQGKVRACDATSYADADPIRPDFLRVGEAAYAIDPLSSQGVQVAMLSAIQGGIALHTILTTPEQTADAIEFYRDRQATAVTRSARTAARLYSTAEPFATEPFWQRRAASVDNVVSERTTQQVVPRLRPDQPVALSKALQVVETPAVVGDLIRRVPALVHPALASPVAFLGSTELVPLLTDVVAGLTVDEIIRQWALRLELRDCIRIMQWLWRMGIVVPAALVGER